MASIEPEECSALMSARSSEQSSLGLIRLDSVAGLSGLLDEGDGGMDPRYFNRVSQDGGGPIDRLEDSSRCVSATDHSSLSFLDPGSPSSGCRAHSAESPLPVSRSCADVALSPVPPSPPRLSAVCLPAGPPASPPTGCAAAADAASPLERAADMPLIRPALSIGAEQPDLPPPAALSPVSVGPAAPALAPAPAPALAPAVSTTEQSDLLASRYLRAPQTPRAAPGGRGGMLTDSFGLSMTLDGGGIGEIADNDRLPSPVLTAEEADISGEQISARSTSIGAACSPGSLTDLQDGAGVGFRSGCLDGMEDFQREFDAGGFVDGGAAFEAELDQAEQSLDRNGLPLVNFSLSSGTYDPHAKVRPSGFEESVNISQFLKAGSYPMGVLGDASGAEPPPRFSMSMVQNWQATSGRFPEEDFDSTTSTLPHSRDTFSVSRGSGYSQIHGSGGGGPVRVGTYTVLTAAGAAPSCQMGDDTPTAPAPAPARRREVGGVVAHPGDDVLPVPSARRPTQTQPSRTSMSADGSRGAGPPARTASAQQRYSGRVGRTTSEEGCRASQLASVTISSGRTRAWCENSKTMEHTRSSQESQDASVTLVNASRPSQDSQDSQESRDGTLTPDRSRTGPDAATPVSVRPRSPLRRSAALGDSLRRKIVDVLNRTEEARLQLLVPGRQTPAAAAAEVVTIGQQPAVGEMSYLSEQPAEEPAGGGQQSANSASAVRAASPTSALEVRMTEQASVTGTEREAAVGDWTDASLLFSGDTGALDGWEGSEWPQAYSRARSDERRRSQQREMAEHKQRQEEKIQVARAQQVALRQQWEVEQDRKEKVARQTKLQKNRDAKAKRDGAAAAKKSENSPDLLLNDGALPPPPLSAEQPAHEPTTATSAVGKPDKASAAAALPVPSAAAASRLAATAEHEVVTRVLQELESSAAAAPSPALTVQQVVETVMRQLAMPDVSLDESCRSRAELNVTEVLHELRGEGEQLISQIEQRLTRPAGAEESAAAGGGKRGTNDIARMTETVHRLHRGLPARPRGEQPRRRSPVRRPALNPVQRASSQCGTGGSRPATAASKRRPASASAADRGADDPEHRRRDSAHAELAVRGRRVPRMGVRRHVGDLTSDDSDRGRQRGKHGSPGKPARKSPGRASAAAVVAVTAAAEGTALSTCPDTASSDGSGRTYSIASDRAPGSLPAVMAEMEQGRGQTVTTAPAAPVASVPPAAPSVPDAPVPSAVLAAPVSSTARATLAATANPDLGRVSTDYESPEFLVALAARRYPSSTPSLARSVADFAARDPLDHVSPIALADSDASGPGGEANGELNGQDVDSGAGTDVKMGSEPGGDLKTGVPTAGEAAAMGVGAEAEQAPSVAFLVPPPAAWPSEESSVGMPAVGPRQPAGTSTGSVATTAASVARPSGGTVPLPGAASLQGPQQPHVAGSSSAEVTGGTSRPQRSRIPTPVRRHVSDLAAAACQSAPCLLQRGPAAPPPPPPPPPVMPTAVPAAVAAGRRPGAAFSGGDRRAGPLAVVRSNSVSGAATRSVSGQPQVAKQAVVKTRSVDQTLTGRGRLGATAAKTVSRPSAQVHTSVPSTGAAVTGAGAVPPVEDQTQMECTAARRRTPSVSMGVQTSDLTFTLPTPVTGDGETPDGLGLTEKPPLALVSAGAQTETGQWVERAARERDDPRIGASDPSHHGDTAPDRPVQPNKPEPLTNGEHPPDVGTAHQTVQTARSLPPLSDQTEDSTAAAHPTTDGRGLVDAPDHVTHPDVLCTDVPTDICIPVTNRSEHWIQLVPSVVSLALNGSPLPVEEAPNVVEVSLRTRTLLDRHQEAAVRVGVTPRVAGRVTVTLALSVEPIERRLIGGSFRVELRLVAERPAVEVLSQEPGVLDFGTLAEDCRKVMPLMLVNLSRAAVPVTLTVLSAGRAFHLPDDAPAETAAPPAAEAPTRLAPTVAKLTLPAADATRQGISPVSVSVALMTPCLQPQQGCPPLTPLLGRLEVCLDGGCPPPAEPLLSCRLLAAVGRVKLRTRTREPLELRCRPAQTASVNLPMRNAGNIPLELRLSVTGLRDFVWVRPERVTVPPGGERDVMVTYQPGDLSSAGRGLLVLTVQPDGVAYEVDIIGVIGDCRAVERQRPSSPEMKSARRHTQARGRLPSSSRSRSRSHSRSPSRSVSPLSPTASGGGRDPARGTEARDTAVQTSLLTLAPTAPAPAPAQPTFRQPAQPPQKSQASAALSLHSNKAFLFWSAARCGQPAARSLTLRNNSETEPLALRMAFVNGPQFTFRMFDGDPAAGGGGAAEGATAEFRLLPRSEREITVLYEPTRVETVAASLVIKPVMRSRNGVGKKFTIPLIAYSGTSDVQLSVSAQSGLQLGELHPGAAVRAPLTVTNGGNRRAFVNILAYRDAECRHPLPSAEFSAGSGGRLSLAAGEERQVTLVLRVTAGSPPPAAIRVLSGDDLFRQAFNQLSRERPLSFRALSPGLMEIDFGGPFEGEKDPEPAELSALKTLPSLGDTFFSCLKQTRIPVRATIRSRQMDSSEMFSLLHADDTVASILNNTSFGNVTRESRRPAAAVTRRAGPAQGTESAPAQGYLDTSQRPVRIPAPSAATRLPPPVPDWPLESGPVGTAPEQAAAPSCALPPTVGGGGGGRPAPLQLISNRVLFPTTAVGQRSAAALDFTNSSEVELKWTLETLVKPWVQSTPRATDLTQCAAAGEVFRFHPTQGEVRPGQTVSLAARFSPPAVGYFTQTVYLVSAAAGVASLDDGEAVQPCCLPVQVAGQAAPAAAAAGPEPFPLIVEPDTIEFSADRQRVVKLEINNKTRLDYEFELDVTGPFSVNHERMLSRARRYIHLPVTFRPPGVGLFTGRLTLSLPRPAGTGPLRCYHVTLLGEEL